MCYGRATNFSNTASQTHVALLHVVMYIYTDFLQPPQYFLPLQAQSESYIEI